MRQSQRVIIDADLHFMEVHDSWIKHLDRKFWDRRFDPDIHSAIMGRNCAEFLGLG